jgi:hypothetical protein
MKLTPDETHSMELKNGKNRCRKCRAIEPDLTKPCPKAATWVEPAGAGKK